MDLRRWVNDGLIVLYFSIIGLEVRREASVGELRRPGEAALPLLAGVGGVVLPALINLLANSTGEAAQGWGIVVGTDTAFMLGASAVVGPSSATQLRLFVLPLTVVDDLVAVAIIGIMYSHGVDPAPLCFGPRPGTRFLVDLVHPDVEEDPPRRRQRRVQRRTRHLDVLRGWPADRRRARHADPYSCTAGLGPIRILTPSQRSGSAVA